MATVPQADFSSAKSISDPDDDLELPISRPSLFAEHTTTTGLAQESCLDSLMRFLYR